MAKLLDSVDSPADLRKLPVARLQELAGEIREVIVDTVSRTGGHLAANLGVVELTIALHRVFDSPKDKIVWDVGHQCYAHKLLTGRRDRFGTVRQTGGLSGFPAPAESPHDAFAAGHGSTSVSAALGMCMARDRRREKHKVVAVIGDGALMGGLALEGLNQAGHLGTDITVVLNDNGMSISRNVGALAKYLNRVRFDPGYRRTKQQVREFVEAHDRFGFGSAMLDLVERVKDGAKHLFVPGMLFECLGFDYVGPVDGHNIPELLRSLELARGLRGPILVHVHTTKGRGYPHAEEDAEGFHGTQPFDVDTGERKSQPGGPARYYTDAFADALVEIAATDERVVAITAAMAPGTGLSRFAAAFPNRVYDVGMAEQHAVTFAAGLAAGGLRPVVAIYSTFLQRSYDQIVHDVCLQGLPVVFCLDRAGIVGEDGPTHHGVYDLSYLRHIPELVVMAPWNELEMRDMLFTALRHAGPSAIRYPRSPVPGPQKTREPRVIPIGRAEVLCEGGDATILAIGAMVPEALRAAEVLEARGVRAEVVSARFAKPMDLETIRSSVEKTGLLVTTEENALAGGFGGAVLEVLEAAHVSGFIAHRLGLPDVFVEHGDSGHIRRRYGLEAQAIADVVLTHLGGADSMGHAHPALAS